MDLANVRTDLADVPEDLLSAVVAEAERDAEQVAIFLDRLFLEWSLVHPKHGPASSYRGRFSAEALLELGAALRILRWEHSRLVRDWMELPSSLQALSSVLKTPGRRSSETPWTNRVVQIFVDHFAWRAAEEHRADLLIESADEDWLADRIAAFLWENRSTRSNTNHDH